MGGRPLSVHARCTTTCLLSAACLHACPAQAHAAPACTPATPSCRPLPAQVHAMGCLPGLQSELLGAAPAVSVLLPGDPLAPHPAGTLLLRVWLPHPQQHAARQQADVLQRGGPEVSTACLRVLVYSLKVSMLRTGVVRVLALISTRVRFNASGHAQCHCQQRSIAAARRRWPCHAHRRMVAYWRGRTGLLTATACPCECTLCLGSPHGTAGELGRLAAGRRTELALGRNGFLSCKCRCRLTGLVVKTFTIAQ